MSLSWTKKLSLLNSGKSVFNRCSSNKIVQQLLNISNASPKDTKIGLSPG